MQIMYMLHVTEPSIHVYTAMQMEWRCVLFHCHFGWMFVCPH